MGKQKARDEYAAFYVRRRSEIMHRINAGKISPSMSGIDYYLKPWHEMSVAEQDEYIHSVNLDL